MEVSEKSLFSPTSERKGLVARNPVGTGRSSRKRFTQRLGIDLGRNGVKEVIDAFDQQSAGFEFAGQVRNKRLHGEIPAAHARERFDILRRAASPLEDLVEPCRAILLRQQKAFGRRRDR
jgi:hypothetical protein